MYHAKLDCFHKIIAFYLSEGQVVRLVGVKQPSSPVIISAIRANQLLKQDVKSI